MFKKILTLFILVILSNCATRQKNISLRFDFFDKPSKVLLAEFSGLQYPRFFKDGEQGILDGLINDFMGNTMEQNVRNMDIETTVEDKFYAPISNRLLNKGFKVVRRRTPFITKDFTPLKEENTAPYDFHSLKHQYGVDYAVILEPCKFGVIRSYYGFFPTSRPRGYAHFRAYCVNLEDNALEWYQEVLVDQNAGPDWDAGNNYENVINTCENAAVSGLNALALSFGDGIV